MGEAIFERGGARVYVGDGRRARLLHADALLHARQLRTGVDGRQLRSGLRYLLLRQRPLVAGDELFAVANSAFVLGFQLLEVVLQFGDDFLLRLQLAGVGLGVAIVVDLAAQRLLGQILGIAADRQFRLV